MHCLTEIISFALEKFRLHNLSLGGSVEPGVGGGGEESIRKYMI